MNIDAQKLEVRAARWQDYDGLCDLFRQCNQHHLQLDSDYYREVDPFLGRGMFNTLMFLQKLGGQKDRAIFVAEMQGVLVGAIFMEGARRGNFSWERNQYRIEVDNIIVDTNARREGIGEELLLEGEDWAKKRFQDVAPDDRPMVMAKIRSDNTTSLSFFKTMGYNVDPLIATGDFVLGSRVLNL